MSEEAKCEEGVVEVEQQTLAYKRWISGAEPRLKLLALHGWLDNAASFDVLMEQLAAQGLAFECLAMDAPGHGHSDHKPEQGSYNIWDDVRGLLGVLDHMQWQQSVLLCHSRGAFIGSLLCASAPDRVSALVALDSLIPDSTDASAVVDQLRKHLSDYRRQGRRAPAYKSPLEAAGALAKKTGMSPQAAETLVQRGLRCEDHDEQVWRWRSDPRLLSASAVKFSSEQWQHIFGAIGCPVYLITASRGMARHPEFLTRWVAAFKQIEHESIEGSHHCHLDPDTAPEVGRRVAEFLQALKP